MLRNSKDLPEDQFIHSVENILCGTVDGGVEVEQLPVLFRYSAK